MKKLFIGLLALGSFSSFGAEALYGMNDNYSNESTERLDIISSIFNLTINDSYGLMTPKDNKQEFCLNVGTIDGHLEAVSTIISEMPNASQIFSNLNEFSCQVTQLKAYCDKGYSLYLKDCNKPFPRSFDQAKEIAGSIYKEAERFNSSL